LSKSGSFSLSISKYEHKLRLATKKLAFQYSTFKDIATCYIYVIKKFYNLNEEYVFQYLILLCDRNN